MKRVATDCGSSAENGRNCFLLSQPARWSLLLAAGYYPKPAARGEDSLGKDAGWWKRSRCLIRLVGGSVSNEKMIFQRNLIRGLRSVYLGLPSGHSLYPVGYVKGPSIKGQ